MTGGERELERVACSEQDAVLGQVCELERSRGQSSGVLGS